MEKEIIGVLGIIINIIEVGIALYVGYHKVDNSPSVTCSGINDLENIGNIYYNCTINNYYSKPGKPVEKYEQTSDRAMDSSRHNKR